MGTQNMSLAGKQLSTIVVCILLGSLSLVVVSLRCVSRLLIRGFGKDDYLMAAGELFFIPLCVFVSISCVNGAGRKDEDGLFSTRVAAQRAFVLAEPFYLGTLTCVKSAICLSLLRIATKKSIRYALFAITTLTCLVTFIGFVALLNACHPLSAAWNPKDKNSKCSSNHLSVSIGYFLSAMSLVTDFSCAILPIIILRSLQMNRRLKMTLMLLLGLGFLASSATIARLPALAYYTIEVDYFYRLADIEVWTIVECGLGIIAASAATLRPIVRPLFQTIHSALCSGEEGSHPPITLRPIQRPSPMEQDMEKQQIIPEITVTPELSVDDEYNQHLRDSSSMTINSTHEQPKIAAVTTNHLPG